VGSGKEKGRGTGKRCLSQKKQIRREMGNSEIRVYRGGGKEGAAGTSGEKTATRKKQTKDFHKTIKETKKTICYVIEGGSEIN